MYKSKKKSKSLVLLIILCLVTNILITQAQNEILHLEKDGLLIIEAENTTLTAEWQAVATSSAHTGGAYIVWKGEQYLDETGRGVVNYPIRISRPGTYRLTWRMRVGKGTDVTDHNDIWLKINAPLFYGEKPDGHKVMPRPICETSTDYDCPNGNSTNGFFKVYGQDLKFIWQANTSDNDGHDIYAKFDKAGDYLLTINARSSFCHLDRIVLFHTEKSSLAEATDINKTASESIASKRKTKVSIVGQEFHINGKPSYQDRIYQDNKIEGLLFNARLVQGIFDDLNPETRKSFIYPDTEKWDADRNTDEFVAAMSDWRAHGLLAFSLNLQGGSPLGYGNKSWVNSTFDEEGNIRTAYLNRLRRILNRADELGMVVILGYFYFGQDQHLKDENAVVRAVDNITDWILENGYQNILVEINNECDIYYDHEILKPHRVHELINRVKSKSKNGARLLVSTSYSGGHLPHPNVIATSDYLLLHGNGVEDPARITDMVRMTRAAAAYRDQPILFNEDDHYDYDAEKNNLKSSIENYASWGYFDFRREGDEFSAGFQTVPVDWRIKSKRKIEFFEKIKEITKE